MDDLQAVRSQVKSWERTFKAQNGRHPDVSDIKADPQIEVKYKLYKKLSKAAANSTQPDTPTTPPRSNPKPRSFLPAVSRTAEPTQPLASFNPFSPQKNKGNQKPSAIPPNPFATPVKSRSKPKPRSPSLDPFPATSDALPAPNTAVSRARKRLRGEPVSPSPNKGKRRRVLSQTTLSFPRIAKFSSSSDEDDDGAEPAHSSFVDDSPVKPAANGRAFKLLFDESNNNAHHVKTIRAPAGLFGPASSAGMDVDWDAEPAATAPKSSFPSTAPTRGTALGTATKRRLSDAGDMDIDEPAPAKPQRPAPILIPPSPPPPAEASSRSAKYKNAGKGKGKNNNALDGTAADDATEDSDDVPSVRVNVLDRRRPVTRPVAGEEEYDDEPILRPPRNAAGQIEAESEADSVQVHVPAHLLQVLALSPSSHSSKDESRVVTSLLSGRRATHYDASRGGEIWGVGELGDDDDEGDVVRKARADDDDEDDWEGEGVPWEVGEL